MTLPLLDHSGAPVRYRLSVASRVLAAIVGGYALAAAIQLLLTLVSPVEPAAMGANLVIFAIHAAILLWVFHTRSATRAWVWPIGWTAVVYGVCWLLLRLGGAA
ncbi:iron transporter [Pseudothauera rhizosphaerae]|uniref:Iron transporter n=1 Tax=Pseudothauera rhizosphaerae TaxID=2565932 RepID=A0A4S4ATL9_9RHOO|nr:iron transporter [Pseudothauera rhizosphaerae]THF62529.1 iron transporter [Pseudothauera rhizosphaerae]